jgi:hypothetical protein
MGLVVINFSGFRPADPAAKHASCLEVLYIKSHNLWNARTRSMSDNQGGDNRNGGKSGREVHVEDKFEVASSILLSDDY